MKEFEAACDTLKQHLNGNHNPDAMADALHNLLWEVSSSNAELGDIFDEAFGIPDETVVSKKTVLKLLNRER